jgi:hypothetical protein
MYPSALQRNQRRGISPIFLTRHSKLSKKPRKEDDQKVGSQLIIIHTPREICSDIDTILNYSGLERSGGTLEVVHTVVVLQRFPNRFRTLILDSESIFGDAEVKVSASYQLLPRNNSLYR